MHRLLAFFVPAVAAFAALVGCEPAAPLPAVDAGPPDAVVDRDLPQVDMAPACPDADGDGAYDSACAEIGQTPDCNDDDARIRPGASDPCGDGVDQDCDGRDTMCPEGCTPNADGDPCDAVDDDCDGVLDECAEGQVCEDAACAALPGEPCAVDCARGSACIDGACTPIEPGGLCDGDGDCPLDAFCGSNDACDEFDDRCYAVQGARCADSCDCGGRWLCTDDGYCGACLFDGQCDGGGVCTPAGLCAVPTALTGEALDSLLTILLDCRGRFAASGNAEGCALIDSGMLTADGAAIGALEPPPMGDPAVCDAAGLMARGFGADGVAAIGELFGCAGAPTLDWQAPIAAEREAAACVTHLPAWARGGAGPGLAVAPCGAVVYGRD